MLNVFYYVSNATGNLVLFDWSLSRDMSDKKTALAGASSQRASRNRLAIRRAAHGIIVGAGMVAEGSDGEGREARGGWNACTLSERCQRADRMICE
jgi:hypothetical protein